MKILAIILALMGAPAAAENYLSVTTEKLHEFCTPLEDGGCEPNGDDKWEVCEVATILQIASCGNYILGVIDGMDQQAWIEGKNSSDICIRPSKDIKRTDLNDVVLSYLNEQTEGRDLSASISVWQALREAFPC